MVSRAPFPTYDVELLGGSTYHGAIYVGAPGQPENALLVAGADDPIIGFSGYCRSGMTSREQCGHQVTSFSGVLCVPQIPEGCIPGLLTTEGGLTPRPGDSGGPFYVYSVGGTTVHARGTVVGLAGETQFLRRWGTIALGFGVSIVVEPF